MPIRNRSEIQKGTKIMTLTEAGLIQAIAEETGTIKKEATEMIKSTLENGEDVMISGFANTLPKKRVKWTG